MSQSTAVLSRNVALRSFNTFGLPARAAWFAAVETPAQLAALATTLEWRYLQRFVLGGGSNVVLTGDFEGLVLHVRIPGRELLAEETDAWIVRAGAGENWHDFVRWTLERGWPGLENLSLIPGTVGAAPIQNIGAYGLEMAERFQQLEAVDLETGATMTFDHAACRFGYRDSVFKREAAGRYLITSVTFRLPKHWRPEIRYAELARELEQRRIAKPTARQISDAVMAIRSRKLPNPVCLGNAGSFFKNPTVTPEQCQDIIARDPKIVHYPLPDGRIKLAAGWLIDACGWKGKTVGKAAVYEKQALVLVNRGHGADSVTGGEVMTLAKAIQTSVYERFGIRLEPEPVVV